MNTESNALEGYAIDLLSELAQSVGFNYTLYVVKDGKYGAIDQDGNWNGMVGEIIRKVSQWRVTHPSSGTCTAGVNCLFELRRLESLVRHRRCPKYAIFLY